MWGHFTCLWAPPPSCHLSTPHATLEALFSKALQTGDTCLKLPGLRPALWSIATLWIFLDHSENNAHFFHFPFLCIFLPTQCMFFLALHISSHLCQTSSDAKLHSFTFSLQSALPSSLPSHSPVSHLYLHGFSCSFDICPLFFKPLLHFMFFMPSD